MVEQVTTKEMIETLRYKAENIKAKIDPEFFNEVADALETWKELQKRNMTPEIIKEYMIFEDECIQKDFTFKSLIEAREKQVAKDIHIYSNGEEHCPNCDANLTGMGFRFCLECGQALKL